MMYKPLLKKKEKYVGTMPRIRWWGHNYKNPIRYGLYSINGRSWQGCREIFAYSTNRNTKRFFISASPKYQKKIIKFITKFEEKLKLSLKNRLKFVVFENNSSVLMIETSRFWMKTPLHRSLLTILLRAPIKIKGNTYRDIMKYGYLKQTKKAIDRFVDLNGRVENINGYGGWVYKLSKKNGHLKLKAER